MLGKEHSKNKKIINNAESNAQEPELLSNRFDKIQTWILQHAELIVGSLNPSLGKQEIDEFLNPKAHLFERTPEFDSIFSSCFFIRMSNEPDGDKDLSPLKATGKATYFLCNETKLFYVDYYSNITNFALTNVQLLKLDGFFPNELNQFKSASKEKLNEFQSLINHPRAELIDDISSHFTRLKDIKNAAEFFKEVYNLSHYLFAPIEKSAAWNSFKSQHKIDLNYGSKYYNLIALAFTYKIMLFWKEQCRLDGKLNALTEQLCEAISAVRISSTKAEFVEECTNALRASIQEQLVNIDLKALFSKNEKGNNLESIRENFFFILLQPESPSIYKKETSKFHKMLSDKFEPIESDKPKKSKESDESRRKLRPKSTSFYSKTSIFKDSPSELKVEHSQPINISKVPRLPSSSSELLEKPELIFPISTNTSPYDTPNPGKSLEEPQEAQKARLLSKSSSSSQLGTASLTRRELKQSTGHEEQRSKEKSGKSRPKHKQKAEQTLFFHKGEVLPAEKIGEMTTPSHDHYTFFSVLTNRRSVTDVKQGKGNVVSMSSLELT